MQPLLRVLEFFWQAAKPTIFDVLDVLAFMLLLIVLGGALVLASRARHWIGRLCRKRHV